MNASSEMCLNLPTCAIGRPPFWKRLLKDIYDRKVVPILGKDLLEIEVDGHPKLLECFLAEKLAESWGKLLGPGQDIRHAVAFYKKKENPRDLQLRELKLSIKEILGDSSLPIPKPLLQLASIEGFTLSPLKVLPTT